MGQERENHACQGSARKGALCSLGLECHYPERTHGLSQSGPRLKSFRAVPLASYIDSRVARAITAAAAALEKEKRNWREKKNAIFDICKISNDHLKIEIQGFDVAISPRNKGRI